MRIARLLPFSAAWAALAGCSLLVDTSGFTASDVAPPDDDASTADRVGPDEAAADAGDAPTLRDAAGDAACPTAPNDPSLAAWYPFEETGGDVVLDCSGHGLDAKLLAPGTFVRITGQVGRAIDLDAEGGCFDLGLAPALAFGGQPFTVAAWIKPRQFSRPALPDSGGNPTPQWFFGHTGTSTGVGKGWGIGTDDAAEIELKLFDDTGVYVEATSIVEKNRWLHVTGVHRSGALDVYTDGVLTGTTATSSIPGVDPAARGWLGCRRPTEPPYQGQLDELRIYSRALSATEIAALARL